MTCVFVVVFYEFINPKAPMVALGFYYFHRNEARPSSRDVNR